MNNVERLIVSIIFTCAIVGCVYLVVTPDAEGFYVWDLLQNIPFYTLNALAFYFTVLNTIILLMGLGYFRRKVRDVTVFVFTVKGIEGGQVLTVKQEKPVLNMGDFEHA